MSQVKTIFKNISWLLISQIIASVCGFIWTVLTARYLGVNNYGIMGFAISLNGILAIFMDLGISVYIVREIATDYDSAPYYIGNTIPLKLILSFLVIALTLPCLIIFNYDELTITVTLLFTIETIIKSFLGLFNGSFQAFEKLKYQGIGNTILNTLLLIFILLAIFTDIGIIGIAISYIIANLIALIYEYYVLNKKITKPKFEFDMVFCKNIILASLPFALGGILFIIYYSIDIVMLERIAGSYPTGIYNATYKLISVLTLFNSVYTSVIFPVMSKFYKNNEKLLIIIFEKTVKYLLIIMIPLAIGTMIYSTDIIYLIYGQEYDAASSVLSILIWTVCLLFVNGAFNTLLQSSHKEITTTKTYGIAATFNIVLNLIMIPRFSVNGAAITTVLSDILILIIFSYVAYKMGIRPNKELYYDLMKIIIGSLILGVILYVLNLNIWVAVILGIIIYFIILILLKVFNDDDKYVIKEILNRN
ncbi:MAG: flippase [Methanobrevibacter millerae]|uniref:Flippase n=1 Tax=Methanobrevibacter millerae TaxID=230361 RepID=A0A8T3VM49_9EURY|nr:flippase [Methanobrevibacter millerae]MBE6505274.1 flippase [Methanobrevibacter millerae]